MSLFSADTIQSLSFHSEAREISIRAVIRKIRIDSGD
jgi:hypothetical protein